MITEKKNQHYIPKFYLRNFSYLGNKKQIGVYNINNEIFFERSKLKTQGSQNFFYGYDGKIEDHLANIEGSLSTVIRNIISEESVPKKETEEHFELLLFVTLTDFRNPVRVEGFKNTLNEMRKRAIELSENADVDKLVPNPSHDEIIKLLLSNASDIAIYMLDLDYKILYNRTSKPFISSDFPIVKYNQFLEQKKWPLAKTGYASTGLQIFIPLNDHIVLVFFDKDVYKVGDKKKYIYEITSENDIDELNILQFLNCLETVYFNERAKEHYIRSLHLRSKKYKRANIAHSELSFLYKENDEENRRTIEAGFKNFLTVNSTDCETNLKINGIKIHSNGQYRKLNDTMAQMRPFAAGLKYRNSR